jgi:hypothetical protein
MTLSRKKNIKNLLFYLIIILGILSLSQGIKNALINSQDFQWSPSLLLRNGINPFDYILTNDSHEKILKTQIPNYFHGLYVIFLPFTLLNWETAKLYFVIFNILITIHTIYNFTQHFKLNNSYLTLITAIYLSSTPFRVSLGNGQQSILILYCFSLMLSNSYIKNLISGIGYFKYSFAPQFFFHLLLSKKYLKVFLSILLLPVTFIIFLNLINDFNTLKIIKQPLTISSIYVGPGVGDLMTIVSDLNLFNDNKTFLIYLIILFISIIFSSIFYLYDSTEFCNFTIACIISLIFYKHLIYDYIFLLPIFIISVINYKQSLYKINLLIITYFWYIIRFIDFNSLHILNFILLLVLLLTSFFSINKSMK